MKLEECELTRTVSHLLVTWAKVALDRFQMGEWYGRFCMEAYNDLDRSDGLRRPDSPVQIS